MHRVRVSRPPYRTALSHTTNLQRHTRTVFLDRGSCHAAPLLSFPPAYPGLHSPRSGTRAPVYNFTAIAAPACLMYSRSDRLQPPPHALSLMRCRLMGAEAAAVGTRVCHRQRGAGAMLCSNKFLYSKQGPGEPSQMELLHVRGHARVPVCSATRGLSSASAPSFCANLRAPVHVMHV